MLDVERGVDVDAGGDQFLDIEVALGMAVTRRIAVRQLVDQHQLRPALQDGVDVHLGQPMALVFDFLTRDDLDALQQGLGLAPAVRLDDADHDIDALAPLGLCREQHLIGLADARRGAEKDLEAAATFLPGRVEQCLRRWSRLSLRHRGNVGRSMK